MPKLEQCFRFEEGTVRLISGKYFHPLADAKESWVLQRRVPYGGSRADFDILYLTNNDDFVHVIYCHCQLERRGDREIWCSDSPPTGRIVDDRWAFDVLLQHQFEIPAKLTHFFDQDAWRKFIQPVPS